jgi:hypothetical protein
MFTRPQKLTSAIVLLGLAFAAGRQLNAATNYVTPGQSIQAAVNAASAGDTIIIFGGTYTESVTVNKWLSIQRLVGQSVYVTGSMTFDGIAAAGSSPLVISNLKIGGDGSKRLYVNSCANVTVNNVDLSLSGGFSATGTSNLLVSSSSFGVAPFALASCPYVIVANTTLHSAGMNASTVMFSRVTVNDSVTMDNNATPTKALNLLQCTITNNIVNVSGGLVRILYGNFRNLNLVGTDSVVIGNRFSSPQVALGPGMVRLESGKVNLRNNDISISAGAGNFGNGSWYEGHWSGNNGVWVSNCELLLANNYIHDLGGGANEWDDDRNGIYIHSASAKVEITGNIFWVTRRPVFAPYDNVTFRYNDDVDGLGGHAGGVISDGIIAEDPLFVDKAAGNYELGPGSPCRNAGPPEAWWNDRDSTRNDMGIFGGAAYDPDGKTTDKPITFLLQATPLTVIKGVHTNLTISGAGIVVPK